MATIKSFTSLEQSKKLAEILPLETADMYWLVLGNTPRVHVLTEPLSNYSYWESYPCWSLAALLSVLPLHLIIDNQRYAFSMIKGLNKNGETYAIKYALFNTTFYFHLTDFYNNPVDACYEMIIKLKEQKLL